MIDSCLDEEFVSVGMVLSNVEFKQVAKRVGVPTKRLSLRVKSVAGLPRRCNPYVETLVISQVGDSTRLYNIHSLQRKMAPCHGGLASCDVIVSQTVFASVVPCAHCIM